MLEMPMRGSANPAFYDFTCLEVGCIYHVIGNGFGKIYSCLFGERVC